MKYGSRKFLLSLLVILAATALRAFNLLEGGQWVTVVGAALSVYALGNVSQKALVKGQPPE